VISPAWSNQVHTAANWYPRERGPSSFFTTPLPSSVPVSRGPSTCVVATIWTGGPPHAWWLPSGCGGLSQHGPTAQGTAQRGRDPSLPASWTPAAPGPPPRPHPLPLCPPVWRHAGAPCLAASAAQGGQRRGSLRCTGSSSFTTSLRSTSPRLSRSSEGPCSDKPCSGSQTATLEPKAPNTAAERSP
jgi:hypothetical protein